MSREAPRKLILLRHAKSSWQTPGLVDFDRPLNARGRRNAPDMAQRLRDRGLLPDLILSSPAQRTRETIAAMGLADTRPPPHIVFGTGLYLADPSGLLRAIHAADDRYPSLMLVAHNPGLTELIRALTGAGLDNLPTCGYAEIDCDVESWGLVEAGACRLIDIDYPKRRD